MKFFYLTQVNLVFGVPPAFASIKYNWLNGCINKYDNNRRKAFNDINKVDNIKLQIENKVEKLKRFFAEGPFKALNIFGQFLMTAFESRQQTAEIRRN